MTARPKSAIRPRVKPTGAPPGEANGRAALTAPEVLRARRLARAGATVRELAGRFGRPSSTMHLAVTGRTWAQLPGAVPISTSRQGGRRTATPPEVVTGIRRLAAEGVPRTEIVRRTRLSKGAIQGILSGRSRRAVHDRDPATGMPVFTLTPEERANTGRQKNGAGP